MQNQTATLDFKNIRFDNMNKILTSTNYPITVLFSGIDSIPDENKDCGSNLTQKKMDVSGVEPSSNKNAIMMDENTPATESITDEKRKVPQNSMTKKKKTTSTEEKRSSKKENLKELRVVLNPLDVKKGINVISTPKPVTTVEFSAAQGKDKLDVATASPRKVQPGPAPTVRSAIDDDDSVEPQLIENPKPNKRVLRKRAVSMDLDSIEISQPSKRVLRKRPAKVNEKGKKVP